MRNIIALAALILAIISLIGFATKIPFIDAIRALANLFVIIYFVLPKKNK